jgi:predicted ATPase
VTINSFHFKRFRAFREEAQIELAPLTIIIGRNGGGKSVLTRLPLLLASGLDTRAEAPLDLEAGGISHAVRFEDLIFQRSSQPFALGAEIHHAGRRYRFTTTLRHISERHILGIEEFQLLEDEKLLVHMRAENPEDITLDSGTFLLKGPLVGDLATGRVTFTGLFPRQLAGQDAISQSLCTLRDSFESILIAPSYIGPFRSEQGSLPRIPRQGVKILGPKGEHALDILGDNSLRSDGSLTAAVEDWFERSMAGNRLKLTLTGDLPRLLVHDPLRSIDVDISETGAGFAQVLPIAVQAYAKQGGLIRSALVIVEQPELHLHPAVHGDVMDLLIDTVLNDPDNTRYICETHSEQMITRVRRRIAEGKISAGSVKIVSVWHRSLEDDDAEPIRMISFDEFGNPDSWPIGVFDEAFSDLVHLREAGQKRIAAANKKVGATA